MCPQVSVVLTTFNRKELLKETIDSILAQTFNDFELIVVDNFSDYDFFDHISSFNDNRIRPYQNENAGIIAKNRNFGIGVSSTNLIAFCDDDDLWETNKIQMQFDILKAKGKSALICTGCSFVNGVRRPFLRDKLSEILFFILSLNLVPAKYLLMAVSFITNSSVLISKDILANVGSVSEAAEKRSVEDFDLWLRISMDYDICFIRAKLVRYRLHPDQVSNTTITKERSAEVIRSLWAKLNIVQKCIFYAFR